MSNLREEINEKAAQFPDRWSELEKTTPEEQKELGWDNAYTEGFDDGRQYERDNPVYSHRNGETDDPEVEGWYFTEFLNLWDIELNPRNEPNYREQGENLTRFWGPIPLPKEFIRKE